jgi:hypothetical protein
MNYRLLIVPMVLAVSACSTVQPIPQARGECESMGFRIGTTQFGDCMLNRVQAIEQSRPRLRVGPASDAFMANLANNQWMPVAPTVINHNNNSISCVRRIGNRVECN